MARKTLNLGILAHVDAGKTTLTERLLYAAGVIDEIGSVDKGTTQTDSLALERERGITIKAAVASFAIGEVTVNLIDTPGHPDFIAEVERTLSVLDGAVLVLSAVEGVQPQSRLLMRALQRLRIPTLLFVNKIDRAGAGYERVLEEIGQRLTPAIVAMGAVAGLGARDARFAAWGAGNAAFRASLAEVLAEHDDSLLAAFVEDDGIPYRRLRRELASQTSQALVHPVFFGSAITGAGVQPLRTGIAGLLPAAGPDSDGAASGTVFKIERGPGGEKIAYVRMFSGSVHTRDRLRFGRDTEEKVTAISVFDRGDAVQSASVSAGEIGKLWGLAGVRIGDAIGRPRVGSAEHHFAPPTLETVVVPSTPDDRGRLRIALEQLAEQDPLIDIRQDDARHEISVSLYGEVQKEVIQATLANDFGVDVTFRETTTIYVERPLGTGAAVETLQDETNPFLATVGLRVDPRPQGSGVELRLEVDPRLTPLYIYKTADRFAEVMTRHIRSTLQEGLFGWQVTDCVVTMTDCGYYVGDGAGKRPGGLRLHGSRTSPADFRRLTPIVAMRALERAGTVVCEPIARVRLEFPTVTLGAVLPALARLGAAIEAPSLQGEQSALEIVMASARVHDLQRSLPGLSGGEGVLETEFAGFRAVSGEQPTRRRTTPSPLARAEYVMHIARRATRTAAE
jgi:ribosomal protection tetracycline resistance protein